MSHHGLQAWQIALVVTAAVVLIESAVHFLIKKGFPLVPGWPVRIGGLALLMVLAVVLFVIALGPSLADQLSSVAAAVSAVVALWLTYRTYQQQPKDESRPQPEDEDQQPKDEDQQPKDESRQQPNGEEDGNAEGDRKPADQLDDR